MDTGRIAQLDTGILVFRLQCYFPIRNMFCKDRNAVTNQNLCFFAIAGQQVGPCQDFGLALAL